MSGVQGFNRLQFDYECILNQQIQSPHTDFDAFNADIDWALCLNADVTRGERNLQRIPICCLKESGAERTMNIYCSPNNLA